MKQLAGSIHENPGKLSTNGTPAGDPQTCSSQEVMRYDSTKANACLLAVTLARSAQSASTLRLLTVCWSVLCRDCEHTPAQGCGRAKTGEETKRVERGQGGGGVANMTEDIQTD